MGLQHIRFEQVRFRFGPLLFWKYGWGLPIISVAMAGVVLYFRYGRQHPWFSDPEMLLWVVPLAALGITGLLALMAPSFQVGVGPDGLRTYDGFGIYRSIPWSTIERVRRPNVFIPFVSIRLRGN